MRTFVDIIARLPLSRFQVLAFGVLGTCIVVSAALLAVGPGEGATLRAYATEIVEHCTAASHPPTCYNETVPEYFTDVGFDDMFELIHLVQRADPGYGYCHLAAHKVAEYEVHKDPAQWIDTMVRCPTSGMCANGCMHGALITRFIGAEEGMSEAEIDQALDELHMVCEPRDGWNPSGLDKGNCYHGLGHLAMYMTLGDIQGSLDICDRLGAHGPGGGLSELCYGGVFMQLFQPLEPEDEAMVAHIDVSQDNFVEFCNGFPRDGGRISCFQRGSMLFEHATTRGPEIQHFCGLSKDPSIEDACYDMVFALVGSGSDYDVARIDGICRTITNGRAGQCYGMAAVNMIDADPAFIPRVVELCETAPTDDERSACFGEVAQYAPYRFNEGTEDARMLCAALPDEYYTQCTRSGS